MATLEQMLGSPMMQMGMGMLAGNQGPTGGEAFSNALRSGLLSYNRSAALASEMARQKEATELVRARREQLERQQERNRQLTAAAPQISAGLNSPDPQVRQQAVEALMGLKPELMGQHMMAQAKAGMTAQSSIGRIIKDIESGRIPPDVGQKYIDKMLMPGVGARIVELIKKKTTKGLTKAEQAELLELQYSDPLRRRIAELTGTLGMGAPGTGAPGMGAAPSSSGMLAPPPRDVPGGYTPPGGQGMILY